MKRSEKIAEADRLFSRRIRDRGFCQAQGFVAGVGVIECWGPLQCAHVIRRRKHSLRWNDDNAACLCMRHHLYLTGHRTDEDRFHEWLLSPERFEELRRLGNDAFNRPNLDEVLARLRGGP